MSSMDVRRDTDTRPPVVESMVGFGGQTERGSETAGMGSHTANIQVDTVSGAEAGPGSQEWSWARVGSTADNMAREGEASRRLTRARASALMDPGCHRFLRLLSGGDYIRVDALSEAIKNASDWLKIGLLLRADYIETLDSSIRLTTEGQDAWIGFLKVGADDRREQE